MGWLRFVGSLKLSVSLAEYSLFYRALLQKRPVILRSLLIIATAYLVFYVCASRDALSCRALLGVYWAVLRVFRALWRVCMALLRVDCALVRARLMVSDLRVWLGLKKRERGRKKEREKEREGAKIRER